MRFRVSPPVGSSQPTCTESVLPGGNGPCTVMREPLALASGDEPGRTPVLTAPSGIVEDERLWRVHGAARAVDDLEEVIHRDGFVAGFKMIRGLSAERDLAGDGRSGQRSRACLRVIGRCEQRPDAALPRCRKLLRLEVLAIDCR